MTIDQTIFKANDIRGIYPDQITEDIAYKIGRALVLYLKAKNIMVAQDTRLSTPALAESLIQGILDQGADVVDVGLVPSPTFLYGVSQYKNDGGIMVTASHNPRKYNGFKVVGLGAESIGLDQLQQIKDLVLADKFEDVEKGTITKKDLLDEFIDVIFDHASVGKLSPIKLVADASSGMAGVIFPKFFDQLNCEVTPLYWELDGNFPHHLPNPLLAEATLDLTAKVLETKADLGIITDGDADRIFFADEKGQVIKSDYITALIAKKILAANPGQKIAYDAPSSRVVKETIVASGGQPFACKVGHHFIKEKMVEEDIIFAAENSGHYYLKNNGYREEPFVILLYILKIMSEEKKPLSEIVKPFQKYVLSGDVNFEVEDKQAMMDYIESKYQDGQVSHFDGVTVDFDDWWFNLRPSNTEPLLRLNMETANQHMMDEKIKEIGDLIKNK